MKEMIRKTWTTALLVVLTSVMTLGQTAVALDQSGAPKTGTEILSGILAQQDEFPIELYPPGYLEELQAAGDSIYPPQSAEDSTVITRSVASHVMNGVRPMDNQPASDPPTYMITDLGTLGGNSSESCSINASGQVVGYSTTTANGGFHAFLWQNGSMQDLGALGGSYSAATSINASGQVAGYSTMAGNQIGHAFLWQDGSMQDIGTLGGSGGGAYSINASGQVVGYSTMAGNDVHAFLWQGGTMYDLNSLLVPTDPGWTLRYATAINDKGQIVGYGINSQSQMHAFLWQNGSIQDIGTLGGNVSVAFSINASSQVVGYSYISGDSGDSHAFLWQDGSMQDIGTFGGSEGIAYSINASGQVVGGSFITGDSDVHAFLWQGGTMYDLNSLLVPTDPGWTLQYAVAINDKGQIVGYGINSQPQIHAFLLNPYSIPDYTGFHQGNSAESGTEFGYADSIQHATSGTENNYGSDGRAKTVHYGCALCSLASMLTSVSGFESMTPTDLDSALTSIPERSINAGYVDGCNMNWPAIARITGSALTLVDSKSISASSTDHSALDQYLNDHCWGNRYRVILQLKANGDVNQTHYIFVVGKADNDWIVFDPGWSSAFDLNTSNPDSALLGSLNGHFTGFTTANSRNWVFTVTGVKTYQVNAPSSGNFNEVAHSPVELLVTDPNGKRVGYDPVAGVDVFEIPGASYTRDYPILDAVTNIGGAGDISGLKTVSIPSPVGGSYSTVLTGTASGSYTLDSSIIWPGNSQTYQTITNTTDVGVTSTNASFVIVPPVITSTSMTSGTFSLSFTSQTNVTYVVEWIGSLTDTNWSSVQTLTATDTNTTANQTVTAPMTFFRVRSQ